MDDLYSKWLLVSDIDGTLNTKSFKLPENNKKSINEFVNNGGNFTLCSGRNLQSLSIHYNRLGINTPAIFLNGAGIYDFKNKEMIYQNFISSEGEEIILNVLKNHKLAQLTVFTSDKILLATRKCIYGRVICKMDKLDCQLYKKISDLPRGIWGKVSFFGTKGLINKLKNIFSNEDNSKYFECFKTSPFTLEVVRNGVNKGAAVLKLAELLNIDESNTAAIGDYYNDVEMLKMVAHPVCCGQAPDDIKEISEYVACHCNDGAVADFIDYIKTNYIK